MGFSRQALINARQGLVAGCHFIVNEILCAVSNLSNIILLFFILYPLFYEIIFVAYLFSIIHGLEVNEK